MRLSPLAKATLFSLFAAGLVVPPVQAQDFDEGQDPVWDIDDDLETEDDYLDEERILLDDGTDIIVPADEEEYEPPGGYGSTGDIGDRYEAWDPDVDTSPDNTVEPNP